MNSDALEFLLFLTYNISSDMLEKGACLKFGGYLKEKI
jgi:hypothetical protein